MTQSLLPAHLASRALVNWLDGADAGPLPWRLRARLSWNAFWFEHLLRTQTRASSGSRSTPLFVMGFWRSGTTLLHNLLYERYQCTAPLTWQCFAPSSFALQQPPLRDVRATRPMDDGVVHRLGPQEDEFALLLLGEPSLYRALLDPTRAMEVADACFADAEPALSRWQDFVALLARDNTPVLLKSPNHVFRLRAITRLWPDAESVWIARPFAEVLASNLRMWDAMIGLHRLRDDAAVDLQGFLARAALRYRDILAGLLDRPPRPMLWLDYADLTAEPDAASAAAARFLNLPPRPTPLSGIDAEVHQGRTPQTPRLLDELADLAGTVDRLHARALSQWGRDRQP